MGYRSAELAAIRWQDFGDSSRTRRESPCTLAMFARYPQMAVLLTSLQTPLTMIPDHALIVGFPPAPSGRVSGGKGGLESTGRSSGSTGALLPDYVRTAPLVDRPGGLSYRSVNGSTSITSAVALHFCSRANDCARRNISLSAVRLAALMRN